MKKRIVIVILVVFLLCGCESQIPLMHPTDSISKITLHHEEKEEALCTLTGTDIDRFMNDLMELTCYRKREPTGEFGYLQIHIHYENGDIDIIGYRTNGYIRDGKLRISGYHYYKEEDFLELFRLYTDQLP